MFADLLQVQDNQLASSLLTTCSRLVFIKLKQAMRRHPDINLEWKLHTCQSSSLEQLRKTHELANVAGL